MPSRDYSDLSRLASEGELDVDELGARLERMSDRELLEFGLPNDPLMGGI